MECEHMLEHRCGSAVVAMSVAPGQWKGMRLSSQEHAKIVMSRLSLNLQRTLELGQPRLHQVDVVEKHPASCLAKVLKQLLCDWLLTLAH